MSTRDNMRRELKELAKLAETMGKESPAASMAAQEPDSIAFPAATLERPLTPASSSRVSVGPFATSTAPPVFDTPEPSKRSGGRTAFIAVVVGASLAAALVGGAFVGRSLAGSSASAVVPVTAAAAALAAQGPVATQPEVAPAALPAAAPQAPSVAAPPVTVSAASSVSASAAASPTAGAAPVRKHAHPPTSVMKAPVSAAVAATPESGSGAAAAAKQPAGPALAKPKAASVGGGSDSLEDLIRKEVAGQKK